MTFPEVSALGWRTKGPYLMDGKHVVAWLCPNDRRISIRRPLTSGEAIIVLKWMHSMLISWMRVVA